MAMREYENMNAPMVSCMNCYGRGFQFIGDDNAHSLNRSYKTCEACLGKGWARMTIDCEICGGYGWGKVGQHATSLIQCEQPEKLQCIACNGTGKKKHENGVQMHDITPDVVAHPPHYNGGKIEVIDAIEDWLLGFNDGNVVKYVARHRMKGTPTQDLEKALWYLIREPMKMHGVTESRLVEMVRTCMHK